MGDPAAGISWTGVGLTYPGPPAVEALRPTDLCIRTGEHVAITGPSGSGKSTLLNLLGLLDHPTVGAVSIGGASVESLASTEVARLRARFFGFVFQQFHLLPGLTAQDNVELGLMYSGVPRKHRGPLVREALGRVGLSERAGHRPSQLSGGEQQRVAIARAIVRDQRFLLADEPTGSLDSRTAASVLALLDQLVTEGLGVICVTHDESVARLAGRRLRVLDGVVQEKSSSPDAV